MVSSPMVAFWILPPLESVSSRQTDSIRLDHTNYSDTARQLRLSDPPLNPLALWPQFLDFHPLGVTLSQDSTEKRALSSCGLVFLAQLVPLIAISLTKPCQQNKWMALRRL
jgi:hypothetical protein